MLLGKIVGKLSTLYFEFLVEGDAKKFDYIQVPHKDYDFVLCQIIELVRDTEKTLAKCQVLGYKEDGRIKQIRTPFEPGAEVLKAQDAFIKDIIALPSEKGAFMGRLENKQIDIHLNLQTLLSKHVAVLAKSGSGKSYTVGVLLEEILEQRVPLLIIDPHGEYSSLKFPSENGVLLEPFGLEPKGYINEIQEYGATGRPIRLNEQLTAEEIIHILPAKLSSAQQSLLYAALQDADELSFDALIVDLQRSDHPMKWSVIHVLNYLKKLDLFSAQFTQYNELVKTGTCSILNLKGIDPEIQQVIVYKLLKDLFEMRKKEKVPPFFTVIEEAHNFLPERSFGEAKSSKILRYIASEGRKFGLGLCVVSQRPARCDKSVLSQCSTQIILKVTNPQDLKAVTNAIEGISAETENEIRNLPVGSAMITGLVDMPLFVAIRPRRSKHGGEAVDILQQTDMIEEQRKFEGLTPVILPQTSKKDLQLMAEGPITVQTYLIPAVLFDCSKQGESFQLLIELVKGSIIPDPESDKQIALPDLSSFSPSEAAIVQLASEGLVTAASAMETLGVSLLKAQSQLEHAAKRDLLVQQEKEFTLHSSLSILGNVVEYRFLGKVTFKDLEIDTKLESKVRLQDIKQQLQSLVEIQDYKECFIVHYAVQSD